MTNRLVRGIDDAQAQALRGPRKRNLAEALLEIPAVGEDRDFRRVNDADETLIRPRGDNPDLPAYPGDAQCPGSGVKVVNPFTEA